MTALDCSSCRFDELIKYDLPDMVDYTLEQTGYKKLGYVGHSQGKQEQNIIIIQYPNK